VRRWRDAFAEIEPSFFEATVALSFLYFAEEGVDLAVVEVGMGGRLDATNILRPRLAAITEIGLDHTEFLGSTLSAIAREKAGIIKNRVPVVAAAGSDEVRRVLQDAAQDQGAPLHLTVDEVELVESRLTPEGLVLHLRTPVRDYEALEVGLHGLHQRTNAAVALRCCELAFDEIQTDAGAVYTGFRDIRRLSGLRGRLDVIQQEPLIIADVAHNAEGLAAALAFIRQRLQAATGCLHVLFATMKDKDVHLMATLLADAGAIVTPVSVSGERARSAGELQAILRSYGIRTIDPVPVPEGLARFRATASPDDVLLITGSHLVVEQLGPW
jgi:dihydrofolate synthase / folylpolyglutamate synthase